MVCLLAVPLLALAVGPAAPADPKNGLAPLQGTWKLASVEINGKAVDVPQNPPRWVIKGNKVRYAGQDLAALTVGATTSPKNIDLAFASPKRVLEGIFAVEKDKVKLCVNRQTDGVKERPQEFATEGKAEWRLLGFTRDKAAAGESTEGLAGCVVIPVAAGPDPKEVRLEGG